MSKKNYTIEYALNSVAEKVLGMYRDGEISKNSALKVLIACREAMKWDFSVDADWDAAVECLSDSCGACLREISPKETLPLFSPILTDIPPGEASKLFRGKLVVWHVCPECFDKLMAEVKKDATYGPRARKKYKKFISRQ
jgi:hypothetical protein